MLPISQMDFLKIYQNQKLNSFQKLIQTNIGPLNVLSLIFLIAQLKMSQSAKRSLRIRKTPAYLLPDNEDQDPLSYPRQMYQREIISPAQELNNFAKLLSKFINSANKHVRQISQNDSHDKLKDQDFTLPKQNNIKKSEIQSQLAHKKLLLKEATKQEELKQSKILPNHKNQQAQFISNKFINADQQKPTKSYSKSKIQNYNISQKINKQRLKQSKKLLIEQNSSLIKSKQALMKPAYLQQQNQQRALLESFSGIRNRMPPTQQTQKKNIPAHIKIFGRSAYHIGIAYHIHLRQLELKKVNINDLNAVDPTYFARKLRQGFFQPERTENQPNTS